MSWCKHQLRQRDWKVSQIPSHLGGGDWVSSAQFSKAHRYDRGLPGIPGPGRSLIYQKSRSIRARKAVVILPILSNAGD
jgi:hypothetical protein